MVCTGSCCQRHPASCTASSVAAKVAVASALTNVSLFCGGARLMERSYLLPPVYPFRPIRMVMEDQPGSCDYYRKRSFCQKVAEGHSFEPEYHVREVIASFLHGCGAWRSCRALDLGANNGWHTASMLALGAHVTALEPQRDLARGVQDTAALNCAADRLTLINAFVRPDPDAAGSSAIGSQWRAGGPPKGYGFQAGSVPNVPLDQVAVGAEFDLVKIDTDGPDGALLGRFESLLSAKKTKVSTFVVECHNCSDALMWRLQNVHKYTVCLLDMHIDRRFIDAGGVDAYQRAPRRDAGSASPEHPAPQPPLPPFVAELYSIRLMKHLYAFRPGMSLEDWRQASGLTRAFENQYLLTREPLLERRFEHPWAAAHPSPNRIAAGYVPPDDGIGSPWS